MTSRNPFTLQGKRILVVGASSGIGAATAALASELGAHVLLASRTLPKRKRSPDPLLLVAAPI